MDSFYLGQYTWLNLLKLSILLIAIYFLLLLTKKLLPLANQRWNIAERLQTWVHLLILIFEPLSLVLIASYFILINPILHGIPIGLILLVGFGHLRNYFNGRIIQLTNRIKTGQKIKIQNLEGIVVAMKRLGLKIKTSKGIQDVGYSRLFQEGFMQLSGDDVGGYHYLNIYPTEGQEVKNFSEKIMDFLATAPYLDHNHSLNIQSKPEGVPGVLSRVIVKEESHLNELLQLIKDNGYECKISKK